MIKRKIKINIDKDELELEVEGNTFCGDDTVMLENDDNVIAATSWNERGYTVAPFLKEDEFKQLKDGATNMFIEWLKETGVRNLEDFSLEKYHKYVNAEQHLQLTKRWNMLDASFLPIDSAIITKRISEICETELTLQKEGYGEFFLLRKVRPGGTYDFNPPHRDVYLDRIRNAVNIYAPLSGSNERSSLPLIPGSHFWKESDIERTELHSRVNGVQFTVPCVVGSPRGFQMTRPNPRLNEVLVFSPYMVHGCAANLNDDLTRISLEMRFWRRK